MLNYSKMMFFSIMVLGTILVMSAETWLGMWMGLELNMVSFIPLIYKEKMKTTHESCMIYFLIQSMGSIIMLFSILINSSTMNSPYVGEGLFSMVISMSMLMKMGAPPFHFWFPEIAEKMSWPSCFLLMTWQKVAPMYIMSCVIDMSQNLIYLLIPIMVLTGSIGGLNQTSIRKIMSYSSMDHMGWMIMCMKFFNTMWIFYFTIYALILGSIIFTFWIHSTFYINQYTSKSLSFSEKIMIIILFLSLGGLPPFLGFLPKFVVIQLMILSQSYGMALILVLTTLITLFYYLRLISSILLINSSTIKWASQESMNNVPMSLIMSVNLLFPMIGMFWL
uniref:NADH-ubiquinone oxidoreductase chain 2 n=1 Tax=Rhynocoris incertis TaxID=488303 RepID=A0A343W904_9HEMI|nr:NADH dehydrogenase subunit 2 [Rhynocoris incertis]AVZ00844.1 NADH dehydrogenase subunit 2 [Rhynocoris incertis]